MKCSKCNCFNLKSIKNGFFLSSNESLELIKDILLFEAIIVNCIEHDIHPQKAADWIIKNIDTYLLPAPIRRANIICSSCGFQDNETGFLNKSVVEYLAWFSNCEDMIEALE